MAEDFGLYFKDDEHLNPYHFKNVRVFRKNTIIRPDIVYEVEVHRLSLGSLKIIYGWKKDFEKTSMMDFIQEKVLQVYNYVNFDGCVF